jgi:hypothetical protein
MRRCIEKRDIRVTGTTGLRAKWNPCSGSCHQNVGAGRSPQQPQAWRGTMPIALPESVKKVLEGRSPRRHRSEDATVDVAASAPVHDGLRVVWSRRLATAGCIGRHESGL